MSVKLLNIPAPASLAIRLPVAVSVVMSKTSQWAGYVTSVLAIVYCLTENLAHQIYRDERYHGNDQRSVPANLSPPPPSVCHGAGLLTNPIFRALLRTFRRHTQRLDHVGWSRSAVGAVFDLCRLLVRTT